MTLEGGLSKKHFRTEQCHLGKDENTPNLNVEMLSDEQQRQQDTKMFIGLFTGMP